MSNKFVNFIANMITEDPDILNEKKKNKKRPNMDRVESETDFDVEDALEDKSEPAKPSKKDRNQKSGLNKNNGAKQNGSAYLK